MSAESQKPLLVQYQERLVLLQKDAQVFLANLNHANGQIHELTKVIQDMSTEIATRVVHKPRVVDTSVPMKEGS